MTEDLQTRSPPVSTRDETTWGSSGDDRHTEIREKILKPRRNKRVHAMQRSGFNAKTFK
jgi:hypothetical protein